MLKKIKKLKVTFHEADFLLKVWVTSFLFIVFVFKQWNKMVGYNEIFWRPKALNFLLFSSWSVPQLWNRISYYGFSAEEDLRQSVLPEFVHQPHSELCSLKMIPCPFYSSLWQLSRKWQCNWMLSFPCHKVIQVTVLQTLPCLVGL